MVSDSSARTNAIDSDTMNEVALAFCGAIQEAGYESMIYFNSYQGYVKYDLSKLLDHSFWFAQYQAQPSFYYDFQMWQYSSKGSVPGIQGEVDMNLYFRSPGGRRAPQTAQWPGGPAGPGHQPGDRPALRILRESGGPPYGADRLTDFCYISVHTADRHLSCGEGLPAAVVVLHHQTELVVDGQGGGLGAGGGVMSCTRLPGVRQSARYRAR